MTLTVPFLGSVFPSQTKIQDYRRKEISFENKKKLPPNFDFRKSRGRQKKPNTSMDEARTLMCL